MVSLLYSYLGELGTEIEIEKVEPVNKKERKLGSSDKTL